MIYSYGVIDEAPAVPVGFGDLYVRFPTTGTALKARAVLEAMHHQPQAQDDYLLLLERVEALPILRALVERGNTATGWHSTTSVPAMPALRHREARRPDDR